MKTPNSTLIISLLLMGIMLSGGLLQAADRKNDAHNAHKHHEHSATSATAKKRPDLPLGLLKSFDRETLWRGYQVYRQVCASCHSMKYLHFRDLALPGGVGLTGEQVKNLAKEFTIQEANGKERKGRPADAFPSPFSTKKEAQEANGGSYPPDLSVIERARSGGALYIFDLLTGYTKAPPNVSVPVGRYYNQAHGHVIAMPPPLTKGGITYDDGTTPDIKQAAVDVALFLQWAADPHREERLSLGLKVMLYTMILAVLMFFVNKTIWRRIKKKKA